MISKEEFLVIYRFRRPYLKIDLPRERQNMIWKKNLLVCNNARVILAEDDFQEWRLQIF